MKYMPGPDCSGLGKGPDHSTLKHDIRNLLDCSVPTHQILFGNYSIKSDFGLSRPIDESVDHLINADLVFTMPIWFGGESEDDEKAEGGMSAIDGTVGIPSVKNSHSLISKSIFLTGYDGKKHAPHHAVIWVGSHFD